MSSPRSRFLDLEAAASQGVTIVARYRGVTVPLTPARVQELLQREEELLTQSLSGGATVDAAFLDETSTAHVDRAVVERTTSESGRLALDRGVSHGSLSGRIKKIYSYSSASRKLRPMHAGFLADLLKAFDWQIPEHPRTTLVGHLHAIAGWSGVSRELREQILDFLARYEAAVGKAATTRRSG